MKHLLTVISIVLLTGCGQPQIKLADVLEGTATVMIGEEIYEVASEEISTKDYSFSGYSRLDISDNFMVNVKFSDIEEKVEMILIWTALITVLVLKALKAMKKQKGYLYNLVAFIRLNFFVKVALPKWLDFAVEEHPPQTQSAGQGVLF